MKARLSYIPQLSTRACPLGVIIILFINASNITCYNVKEKKLSRLQLVDLYTNDKKKCVLLFHLYLHVLECSYWICWNNKIAVLNFKFIGSSSRFLLLSCHWKTFEKNKLLSCNVKIWSLSCLKQYCDSRLIRKPWIVTFIFIL